jgi:hypothetical protein
MDGVSAEKALALKQVSPSWTSAEPWNCCAVLDLISKMAVSWVVVPCCLVLVYRRFRGACCPHRPDDEGSKHHCNFGKLLAVLHGATT